MSVIAKKKIKGRLLNDLGYTVSEKVIPLTGAAGGRYGIIELKEEARAYREVSFCFLYSIRHEAGVILPHPWSHYKLNKIGSIESFLIENDLE